MKRVMIVSVLLAAGVLTLSACGSDAADAEDEVEEQEESTELSLIDDEIKTSDTVFTEAEIEDTELYNAGGVTVTATEFDANAEFGPEIGIRVTNDSDRKVDVIAKEVAVNDYMMDTGLLYVMANPGETSEGEITLYSYDLDARGIDTVATVAITIGVMDDETYEEIGSGERITLTTSAADDFTQSVDDSGEVIYDSDGIRVVNQGLKQDGSWDGDLVLYIENNTDRHIGVAGLNVSVNGVEEEYKSFWADMDADTRAVAGMYLLDIEDQDIESLGDVREISFNIQIIDQDAMEELVVSDPITLTFD